jgi:riboflavin kinase/FMN adenylyltransferase
VVHGSRIGHTIGFPTANIDVENEYKLIAANGVYACRIEWNRQLFKGMGNIGFRPTIDHGDLTIEVHIFDFDKDIYGETITIFFIDRIRDERKFKDLDALRKQLFKDKETVLGMLN